MKETMYSMFGCRSKAQRGSGVACITDDAALAFT